MAPANKNNADAAAAPVLEEIKWLPALKERKTFFFQKTACFTLFPTSFGMVPSNKQQGESVQRQQGSQQSIFLEGWKAQFENIISTNAASHPFSFWLLFKEMKEKNVI